MVDGDARQELGDLMDEILVHRRRSRHEGSPRSKKLGRVRTAAPVMP
jgi:hypothetical protein